MITKIPPPPPPQPKKIDWAKLAAPFPYDEVEWRVDQVGKKGERIWAKVLAYVTSRAIMQRLDEVVGPENWKHEFRELPNDPDGKGALCGISIRVDGEWLTKWDGAGNPPREPIKGGLTYAFKRAAVHWGIGRYLYHLRPGWAEVRAKGEHYSSAKIKTEGREERVSFNWDSPALPEWALPGGAGRPMAARYDDKPLPFKGPQSPEPETDLTGGGDPAAAAKRELEILERAQQRIFENVGKINATLELISVFESYFEPNELPEVLGYVKSYWDGDKKARQMRSYPKIEKAIADALAACE